MIKQQIECMINIFFPTFKDLSHVRMYTATSVSVSDVSSGICPHPWGALRTNSSGLILNFGPLALMTKSLYLVRSPWHWPLPWDQVFSSITTCITYV